MTDFEARKKAALLCFNSIISGVGTILSSETVDTIIECLQPSPTSAEIESALSYVRLFCGVHVRNEIDRDALTEKFKIIQRAAQNKGESR